MVQSKPNMAKGDRIPFKIDRTASGTLIDKVAEGFRRAIVGGGYAAGDVLPGLVEIAQGLGVSVNVVRAASRQLVKEGLIRPRRHLGSVVQPRTGQTKRGRVLIVISGTRASNFINILSCSVSDLLMKHGYLVTEIVVPDAASRRDYTQLRLELADRPDLVLLTCAQDAGLCREVAAFGLPFIAYGHKRPRARTAVGFVREDLEGGVDDFVAQCVRCCVRRVLVVRAWREGGVVENLLEKAGIAVETHQFESERYYGSVESIQRAGLDWCREWLETGRSDLPDLVVFPDDDFLAAGVLSALLEAGVRVPKDLAVVTLANKGLGPVFVKPLSRFEIDAAAFGDRMARYAFEFLNGRKIPPEVVASATYVQGESFPEAS